MRSGRRILRPSFFCVQRAGEGAQRRLVSGWAVPPEDNKNPRKAAQNGHSRGIKKRAGRAAPSRKSQQQTKEDGLCGPWLEYSRRRQIWQEGEACKRGVRACENGGILRHTGPDRRQRARAWALTGRAGVHGVGRKERGIWGKAILQIVIYQKNCRIARYTGGLGGWIQNMAQIQFCIILINFLIITAQKIRRFRWRLYGFRRGRFFHRCSRRNMSRR